MTIVSSAASPIVTWSLIGLNLLVFLIEVSTASDSDSMVSRYGVTPAAFIGDGVVPGALSPVLTLVTYTFLHADAGHIFGNMIFLWVFGDDIEEALGRTRYFFFYLLSGALAALAYIASDAHSEIPLIGASGAIAGIVVAYVMLRPLCKVTVLLWLIPLRIAAGCRWFRGDAPSTSARLSAMGHCATSAAWWPASLLLMRPADCGCRTTRAEITEILVRSGAGGAGAGTRRDGNHGADNNERAQ
jgi:membrane associated rhomboid family serine protease